MPKYKKGDKEFELVDKLKHENKRLKRALKISRKMLDRYLVAEEKGLIEESIIVPSRKRNREQELLEQWACHDCENGYLVLIRMGNRYFRKCNGCGKHTKSQVWDSSVTGLEKKQ